MDDYRQSQLLVDYSGAPTVHQKQILRTYLEDEVLACVLMALQLKQAGVEVQ